jgi:hypothetical protein
LPFLTRTVLTSVLLSLGGTFALGETQVFELKNLDFRNSTLNGLTYYEDQIVQGQFTWTYNPGDFANGSGKLDFIGLPFTIFSLNEVTTTVDVNGITGTLPGNTNWQNTSFDFNLPFDTPLTGPGSISTITSGSYDFTGQTSFYQGEFIGSIIGGQVIPVPEPPVIFLMGLSLPILALRLKGNRLR